MGKLRSIVNVFSFIAVGIVTIVVGAFMLRGTMNMWNRRKDDPDRESKS